MSHTHIYIYIHVSILHLKYTIPQVCDGSLSGEFVVRELRGYYGGGDINRFLGDLRAQFPVKKFRV